MAHRPYPNRDRALRQVERGRVTSPVRQRPSFAKAMAYLESDEHREHMRRIGVTAAEAMLNARAVLDRMPRLLGPRPLG